MPGKLTLLAVPAVRQSVEPLGLGSPEGAASAPLLVQSKETPYGSVQQNTEEWWQVWGAQSSSLRVLGNCVVQEGCWQS